MAPLRWIIQLLRGAAPIITGEGSSLGALRICALDGTILSLPDTEAIFTTHSQQAGYHGGAGYPQARVAGLIACVTRRIMNAVFGPTSIGETTFTSAMLPRMGMGMIILGDRNFAAAALLHQISATGCASCPVNEDFANRGVFPQGRTLARDDSADPAGREGRFG